MSNRFMRGKTPDGRREAMQRKDALIAHLIAENVRLAERERQNTAKQIILLTQLLDLKTAIEQQGFEVHWQPLVNNG